MTVNIAAVPPSGRGFWGRLDQVRVATGVALILVGIPLAWIARDVVHGGRSPVFTATLIVAGIGLILRFAAFRRGELLVNKAELALVLVPLLVITALAFGGSLPPPDTADGTTGALQDAGRLSIDNRQVISNLVVIGFALAGYSQPLSAFRYTQRAVAVVGVIAGGMSLAYTFSSIQRIADFAHMGRFGGVGDDNSAPGTIAMVGAFTLVGAWVWFRERHPPSLVGSSFLFLALVTAVPMIVLSRSRTVMLGCVLAVGGAAAFGLIRQRHFPKLRREKKRGFTRKEIAFWSVVGVVGLTVATIVAVKLSTMILIYWDFISRGAETVLGSRRGLGVDNSAAQRHQYLAHSFDSFSLFGSGYKAMFVDNPVWGAFCDLGVIGGSVFLLVGVLIPLKICMDLALRPWTPPFVRFSIAVFVVFLPSLFLSNTPYVSTYWQYLVLFYVVAGRYWSATRPVSKFRVVLNATPGVAVPSVQNNGPKQRSSGSPN